MEPKTIASVHLTWDEYGHITHTLQPFVVANDYQRADALALSAALLFSAQLGVLAPRYAVDLCRYGLGFLESVRHEPESVQYPLSEAKIDLIQKESTIVCLFHPRILEGGTMELEEAVRRLLTNFLYYVEGAVIPELVGYLRSVILATLIFYLSMALKSDMKDPSFSRDEASPQLNMSMIQFTHTIFPQWKGGPTLSKDRFNSTFAEARKHFDWANRKLK